MSQKWWVLTAVACGTFMATLDSSIVNIALPTLTKELGTDLSRIKWVVIAYLLVITSLLLPFGRLSDQYGRKRIFQLGFAVFTVGSGLCGLSSSLTWLLISRVIQGIGAAMLMANGPAIITSAFPASERGKALGTLAMVVSAGLVSGPSVGGLLITTLGWRSIFLVNLPVGLLGIFLVREYLPLERHARVKAPFDWAGAFLQMILLLALIVVVDPPQISVSGSVPFPVSRLAMAAFIVLLGAIFIRVESDAKAPIFDLSLLKNRTFWTANLAGFLTFVSYSSLSVLMPFFLEEVLHFTPDKAGLFMTAIPLTVFVVAPISGRLSDRLGSRGLSVLGAFVGAFGLFVMAGAFGGGVHENITRPEIVLALCSIGLATGLFQSPNNNAIMGAVPASKLGAASALLATVRNLGLVTGTGMATGIFTWRQRASGDFVEALHFTFYVAGAVAVGAILASLGRKRGSHALHAPAMEERKA
jgi:EmrB/QacA subfamily drug resistance transporter